MLLHEDHKPEDAVHDARHAGQVADVELDELGQPASAWRTPPGRHRRRCRSGTTGSRRTRRSPTNPRAPVQTPTRSGLEPSSPVRKLRPRLSNTGKASAITCHSKVTSTSNDSSKHESNAIRNANPRGSRFEPVSACLTTSVVETRGLDRQRHQYRFPTRRTKRSAIMLRVKVMRNSTAPTKNRLWKAKPLPVT